MEALHAKYEEHIAMNDKNSNDAFADSVRERHRHMKDNRAP